MTTTEHIPIHVDESVSRWEGALYAFLAEKQRRSGSERTAQSYARMLRDCFGRVGKPPDRVGQQDVFAWAHGIGLSGREPSAVTINAPPRLPELLLPVPDPDGCDGDQPLRRAGAPADHPEPSTRTERR